MQVFIKFSVGLDAVELLKQIDELGESVVTTLSFTSHVGKVKTIVPYEILFLFFCTWFLARFSKKSKILDVYSSSSPIVAQRQVVMSFWMLSDYS